MIDPFNEISGLATSSAVERESCLASEWDIIYGIPGRGKTTDLRLCRVLRRRRESLAIRASNAILWIPQYSNVQGGFRDEVLALFAGRMHAFSLFPPPHTCSLALDRSYPLRRCVATTGPPFAPFLNG